MAVLLRLEGTKWLMASLLYGAVSRLMKCLGLRVKDIDFSYNQIVGSHHATLTALRNDEKVSGT